MQKIALSGGGFGYVHSPAEHLHNGLLKALKDHVVEETFTHPVSSELKKRFVFKAKTSSEETTEEIKKLQIVIKKLEARIAKLEAPNGKA